MSKRMHLEIGQRMEAVMALLRREEPAALIARRYGIAEATLYRYRDQFLEAGKTGLNGSGRGKGDARDQQIADLEKQLAKRDQVIGELTIANRILKKTADGLY